MCVQHSIVKKEINKKKIKKREKQNKKKFPLVNDEIGICHVAGDFPRFSKKPVKIAVLI